LDDLKTKVLEDEVSFSSEMHTCEDVGKQVLALAHVEKPDLIVITPTLDSPFREFFPGTYVQEIVHHAKYPILSIPASPIE
jgi:hypothetical protein